MSTHIPESPGPSDWKLVLYRLDQLEERHKNLEAGQKEILEVLRGVPRCQNPGACTPMIKDFEQMKKTHQELLERVNALEIEKIKLETAASTSRWWFHVIYILASTGVLTVLVKLFALFQSKP